MTNHPTIGVLALQGDFAEHAAVLRSLDVNTFFVRNFRDLEAVTSLIIPGGESTVMMKLLKESGLDRDLIARVRAGMPVFGTCAGAVLLSDSHLKLMDISVERNAYGSQLRSFRAQVDIGGTVAEAAFIRAPKITRTGSSVTIVTSRDGDPILVRQGAMLAATFHTEVMGEPVVHRLFLDLVE